MFRDNMRAQFANGLMSPLMNFSGNLGYVTVCVIGAYLIFANSPGVTISSVIAFILYVRQFSTPLALLAGSLSQLQPAAAASGRIFGFLNEEEMTDADAGEAAFPEKITGAVEFKNISFGYVPDTIVIHDFNAVVKPGAKVAIVGPTGAGKSTLINLLLGYYETNSGTITIDGVDISRVPKEELRSKIGIVPQDVWTFKGSIRDNIRYVNQDLSDEKIHEIIRLAGLEHFVSLLPDGADTVLDEGTSISAGQKQLVTIARAMAKNAPILVLDEATSNIDTRMEKIVQSAVDELVRGRTSFVIAHRLSTIKNADVIFVMKDGDIVESGTHQELLAEDHYTPDHEPFRTAMEQDPAALCYTSGSTGVPKGIMLTHINLANGAVPEDENLISITACETTDSIFAINDIGFIYGSMPMFQAVLYGKKLIVITEEEKALSSLLAKRMSKEAAFCIMTTPSIIQNYLFNEQFRNAMKNCRLLVTAGEKLNQRLADRITGLYPDSLVFLNLLGCTECGFGFAIETIRPGQPVTCGKGMKDVFISIRDEEGKILPANEKGEIHIRGVRVSSGYVSASDEGKARFFLEDGLYCYKSGDLGYLDDMGRLIHCGRNNKMVKLHGSRVDLNEVEKRMEECPGIRNAAVKVFTRNDEDYACAFYAADKPVDEQEIREQLLKNLTRAMIPTLFVWMEKLPANDRGKTDYSALKEPERAVRTVEARESIVYDDERLNILCRGVEEILGFKAVRKEDNFFSLGGDSLGGMTFISYLYDNGYRLTLKELYAAPTIEKMVDFLKPVEENADDVVDNGTINEMDEAKYPAEENEMFYYFLPEAFRETLNYWIRYQFTLKKNWSETDFRSVIDRLYKAHPVLRSEFRTEEGGLWHYILKEQEPDIDYKDISSMSAAEQEKVCAACWNEINSRKDSLCSFVCLKTDADKCVVLMRISHAIADGISVLNIIIRNLLNDSENIRRDNYFAYKKWLAEKHSDMSEAKAFFEEYLKGVKDTVIPHGKTAEGAVRVGTERIVVEKDKLSAIQAQLNSRQVTISEAVMYAYGQAAVNASDGEEYTVLSLFSGRSDEVPASNEIVGYMTVGVPVRFKKNATLADFSGDMHRIQDYQYVTSELIKQAAGREIKINDGITSDMFILTDPVLLDIKEVYDESIRLGHRFFMENNDLVIELRYDLNKYSEELYKKIAEDMKKSLFNL